jgi:multidrug efflux pump subunit AcrB
MEDLLAGLSQGFLIAVLVVFLMLAAFFQSTRLAIAPLLTVPAVAAGVLIALKVTGATLNIESLVGSIMAVGVAVANAILLTTVAQRHQEIGASASAAIVEAANRRLRPILMTSLAMIVGMVPMAIGFGEGGQQAAPLGRAVIGGLVAATLTTLFVLPHFYSLIMRKNTGTSVSLDPNDPSGTYYESA